MFNDECSNTKRSLLFVWFADIITRSKRDFYGFKDVKNFAAARQSCVQADGDLVVMRDPSYFNQLQTIANASGIT